MTGQHHHQSCNVCKQVVQCVVVCSLLRCLPPLAVSTTQGALPGGTASMPFVCGVMALAGQLAAEPRITLEVWHKERCAAV